MKIYQARSTRRPPVKNCGDAIPSQFLTIILGIGLHDPKKVVFTQEFINFRGQNESPQCHAKGTPGRKPVSVWMI